MLLRAAMWLATILAGVYLGVAAVLYVYQRNLVYFPDTQRPDAGAVGLAGLKEIELITSDGLRLLGWYLPPPQGRPIVVFFHGNGGHIGHRDARLVEFANAGLGILMPEYRGYGGNQGKPTEVGFYNDAAAAMGFLRQQGFRGDQIIVYGESIGTGVATRVGSQQPIAALVLESPYTSLVAIAARQFSFLPVSLLVKDRFDSLSRIAQVKAPILVLQGGRDEIVPPALGMQLFEAASEPKEFWSAPEGGHNDLYQFGAGQAVLDFLRRRVPSLQ